MQRIWLLRSGAESEDEFHLDPVQRIPVEWVQGELVSQGFGNCLILSSDAEKVH